MNTRSLIANYPHISSVNSSTALIASGETFTGEWELNLYPDVMVSCFSDTAGTLYFDFSNDGVNSNPFPTGGFDVAVNIHEFHTAVKGARYFRVRFVNSAAVQTVFRLYTYYGQYRQASAPLNQPLGLDSDSILVRSVPWWSDVIRGLLTGVSSIKKLGRNTAVGTTFVPISLGGIYRTPQTAGATALRIKAGGNANDTAAGTGARTIKLEGLDENFNTVTEILVTNGALASLSTTTLFTRLNEAGVEASGTYANALTGSHADAITIENSAGTEDWATIDAIGFPKGTTEIGAYSVPAGKSGVAKLRNVSIDSGKTIDLIFFSRTNIHKTAAPYDAMKARSVITGVTGGTIQNFGDTDVPFGPYIGPTDIGFMAKVAVGTAVVAIEFEVILYPEA